MTTLVLDRIMLPQIPDRRHPVTAASRWFAPARDPLVRVGSRRGFLQFGLGLATAATLTELGHSRCEAGDLQAAGSRSPKSVIQIWLSGGPSQIDMWDPKPDMPAEIRGPFGSISTAVSGVAFSELMPRQAALMDKLAVVRSVDASGSNHWPVTFQSTSRKASRDRGDYPSIGSLAARFRGANRSGLPAFVGIPAGTSYPIWYDVFGAGHLGSEFEPVDGARVAGRFSMPEGIDLPHLQDRDQLRRELDRFRSQFARSSPFEPHERHTRAALEFVLGGAAERAFDLNREPDSERQRYGSDTLGASALLARRLVEAGVTFVVLSDKLGSWDHHGEEIPQGGIDKGLRRILPRADQVIATLIEDLDQRGLLDSTLVLAMGEFGRGPVLTKTGGRDHWLQAMSLVVAGGGIRGGQVIGKTDRQGGEIVERRLGPGDLAATIFRHLDIDPNAQWINPAGRPVSLVEEGSPIRELL